MPENRGNFAPALIRGADPSDRPLVCHLLLIVLVAAAAFAVWRLSDVLIAFGATLLALLLRGLAGALSRRTPIPEAWAVALVVFALLSMIGAMRFTWRTCSASDALGPHPHDRGRNGEGLITIQKALPHPAIQS